VKDVLIVITFLMLTAAPSKRALGQTAPLSESMASTVFTIWKDSIAAEGRPDRWTYEQGVLLKGIEGVWYRTGDGRYFKYIQHLTDRYVNDDGTIRTYKPEDYNIDNILPGRNLLLLYKVTGQEKYRKAADHLRAQLRKHPRTSEGGFWHKQIYPSQMWLDGLYMGEPFYAEYAATFHEQTAFDDIARQFVLMEKHSRDLKTGLLYHGWDESRKQRWSNPATGRSPNFWGRAMGWYAMALVDTLDYFPKDHPKRPELLGILRRLATGIAKYQEPKSGLWYQVLDKGGQKGNYLESSASSMFVYALAKGVRQGYLPKRFSTIGERAYQGIKTHFIEKSSGQTNLNGTVSVSGLGGNPYRDGSYEYYLSEQVVTNDPKGVGAFLLASNEMEIAASLSVGQGRTVLLDYYFNNETKKDGSGRMVPWHYKWDEMPNSGFSFWANIFQQFGVRTEALAYAPTAKNLQGKDVYILVDPDTESESQHPNYVQQSHIQAISKWVKSGGVLVLMANDVGNSELDRFNNLAKEFGIEFNKNSKNRVQGNNYAMGRITVADNHPIFKTSRQLFLKEISTLSVSPPAKIVLEHQGDAIVAVAKVGRGTVFAVGDPWFYNEYVDGRRLPPEFQNYQAAKDLTRWLIRQTGSSRQR